MNNRLASMVLILSAWGLVVGCGAPLTQLLVGPTFVDGTDRFAAIEVDSEGRIVGLHTEVPERPSESIRKLPGALAIPGLHDAHLHLSGIGLWSERVDLRGAQSIAEVRQRLQSFMAAHPDVAVVDGRGWDQNLFVNKSFPHAKDLGDLTDKPIVLTRVDGHALWVNQLALNRAMITPSTKAPVGGIVVKDTMGAPTGILVDRAMDLVRKTLPKPTDEDITRWFIAGAEACAAAGLVAVHDMGMSPRKLTLLAEAVKAKRLPPLRIFVYLDGSHESSYTELLQLGFEREIAPRLRVMGVKLFSDGALGSRGAALLNDYADEEGSRGHLLMTEADLRHKVSRSHDLGFQVAIHAIGDHGVRASLSAIAGGQGATRGRRHRIEHAQVVHETDFSRFKPLGVVASMQPSHATSDMPWAGARLGPRRLKGAYAWRRMLNEGVHLAFGSDAPVEDHAPLWGIWAAVTRQSREGLPAEGWTPDQKLTSAESIAAFSAGAAYAVHRENELGSLKIGFRLDLTLLNKDPRESDRGWSDVVTVGTVIDGVWTSPARNAYH
jgi:predicted amidohydrolase YtcJ